MKQKVILILKIPNLSSVGAATVASIAKIRGARLVGTCSAGVGRKSASLAGIILSRLVAALWRGIDARLAGGEGGAGHSSSGGRVGASLAGGIAAA
jgi:hypothetical protein